MQLSASADCNWMARSVWKLDRQIPELNRHQPSLAISFINSAYALWNSNFRTDVLTRSPSLLICVDLLMHRGFFIGSFKYRFETSLRLCVRSRCTTPRTRASEARATECVLFSEIKM